MRFRFDSEDHSSEPDPLEPAHEPTGLDHAQRVEFLRLLHDGLERTMACAQLGIRLSVLKRTMARNGAFRKAVEHVEQVRADNLFSSLYVSALNGNTQAAMFLLSREDRASDRRGRSPR